MSPLPPPPHPPPSPHSPPPLLSPLFPPALCVLPIPAPKVSSPIPSPFSYQVSRLILFPNLAYKSTFNSSISSLTAPNLSCVVDTDSSILVIEEASSSRTSSTGREMNVSPTLYLYHGKGEFFGGRGAGGLIKINKKKGGWDEKRF